jgi:hypothetical protein
MSIPVITTLAREQFEKISARKQKQAFLTFQDYYPSLKGTESGDTFYTWYYVHYMISEYTPVFVMLPKEAAGPFNALFTNFVDFFDEETGEEDLDFWSIDVSIVNSSVDRVAECSTGTVTEALEKKLLKHLKAIKSLPEEADDEFEFTSIDLMMAMALALYDLINNPIQRTLTVKELGKVYRAFIAEDKRIAQEEDTENYGHPFTICTRGAAWLQKTFFPEARVMGYAIENNPRALLGTGDDGHDFLLVAERYVIDFWPRRVLGKRKLPIMVDIQTQPELARKLYGDPEAWEDLGY